MVSPQAMQRLMFIIAALFFIAITFQAETCFSRHKAESPVFQQNSAQTKPHPKEWQIAVTPSTRLDSFKNANATQVQFLPASDLDDRLPLPRWFRIYLRRTFPNLPKAGKYQYPTEVLDLLQWLEMNQNFTPTLLEEQEKNIAAAVARLIRDNERRAGYPQEWDVPVPLETKLDSLSRLFDRQLHLLPPGDLEDSTPLPIWFRVYLRQTMPDLATSGPYQYPRVATRMLQKMLDNPDSAELKKKLIEERR